MKYFKFTIYSITFLFIFIGFVSHARADYYAQGVLASKNILSGATVTAISGFTVIATVPSNTTVGVKFSQDKVNYYNSSGVKDGWDSCANGTTNVDLSGLSWTGGLLFYKIQLTTTDSAATPAVSSVQVDYTGTAVPSISGTTYYDQGILESKNLLSGATVTAINGFEATATVVPGTTVGVKFSQDKVHYYNSANAAEEWDSLSDGVNNIDLSGLGWSGGSLFYKIKMESLIDDALAPSVSEIGISYDGGAVPPISGTTYYSPGILLSTDILSGMNTTFNGSESFGYSISSLPFGTTVEAQFSRDGTNFYNSSNTFWGWDTLSSGVHLSDTTALSLSTLAWNGATSFYYKLRLTTAVDNATTPIVSDAGLLQRSAEINSPDLPVGSKITINMSLTDKMTNGLVGMWSFDGSDINGTTAYDRSTGGHNGTINGATPVAGKNGQALDFNGTSSYVSCGNVGNGIKTISFWMKADVIISKKIMDFDGTKQIEIDGTSHVLATGFPAATVYVDGVAGSTVNSDWHHIAITDTTGVNGSAVDISRVSSGYFDGRLDEIRFYNRAFTAIEVGDLFHLGHAKITN